MKKNQGITLVILVITIIIMIILSSVSIVLILNEGLFDRAREASNGINEKSEAEKNNIEFLISE